MEKFDIDNLNGLDYESGKKLLLKAGYSEKKDWKIMKLYMKSAT